VKEIKSGGSREEAERLETISPRQELFFAHLFSDLFSHEFCGMDWGSLGVSSIPGRDQAPSKLGFLCHNESKRG
jgi:hypothetical protein